jgi:hypothetical protein
MWPLCSVILSLSHYRCNTSTGYVTEIYLVYLLWKRQNDFLHNAYTTHDPTNLVVEDSSLLGCDTVSLEKFLAFWRITLLPCSGWSIPKNKPDCLTMKMKVVWSLKVLGTTDPTRQCHITEDLSLPHHCCENHKFCIRVVLSSNPILTWYSPCIWLQSCKSCPCGFRLGQFSFDPFWYL